MQFALCNPIASDCKDYVRLERQDSVIGIVQARISRLPIAAVCLPAARCLTVHFFMMASIGIL